MNLDTALEKILSIYIPELAKLHDKFPKIHGNNCYVDRDNPSILARMKAKPGYADAYHDAPFEKAGNKILAELAPATEAILRSCPMTEDEKDKLSIVSRKEGSSLVVRAIISGISAFAMKEGFRFPPDGLVLTPAALRMNISTDIQPEHLSELQRLCDVGPREVVAYLNAEQLVDEWMRRDDLHAWLEQFPDAAVVTVEKQEGVLYVATVTPQTTKPRLVLGEVTGQMFRDAGVAVPGSMKP